MFGPPRRCPDCDSVLLRPSKSGLLRRVARFLFLYPIRCQTCGRRVWVFALREPEYSSRGSRRDRKPAGVKTPGPPTPPRG